MSKCNKAKNPCKICLGTVSQKNGLQCQGACQSWVHYTCLNYTPGKIKDIKAGIIKVTCPCPDCKTSMPKEYRTDGGYSCSNQQCPANRPPKCENQNCPINEGRGNQQNMRPTQTCPLSKCGTDCKQYSSPQLPNNNNSCPPNVPPCMPSGGGGRGGGGRRGGDYSGMSPNSSSDACMVDQGNKCPSGCSSNKVAGDYGSNQTLSSGCSSGSGSFQMVEQMCNTVGQLTNQINELMIRMKQTVKEKNAGGGGGACPGGKKPCPQKSKAGGGAPVKSPKPKCPQPCFCPGNPGNKK